MLLRTRAYFLRVWHSTSTLSPLAMLVYSQGLFIGIGVTWLDFNISWIEIVVTIFVATVLELLLANAKRFVLGDLPTFFIPLSALAAAFGILIFFRAANPWYFALTAGLAIASKYLIRVRGAHLFNPSNFAVVTLIFLLPFATTAELTQWGSNKLVLVSISSIAFTVAYRSRVILTTVSFLTTYTVLLLAFLSVDSSNFAAHHLGLLGPSLVLFSAYMITDPRTSPSSSWGRVLHGVSVACLYFVLETAGVRYALFASSFVISIGNLLSAQVLTLASATTVKKFAPNVFMCIVAVASCAAALGFVVSKHSLSVPIYKVSPMYLLFGTESGGLKSCLPDPTLVKDSNVTFEGKPFTSGAAWGDYNEDTFDDLFVSNTDSPSKLYMNKRGGGFVDVTSEAGLPEIKTTTGVFVDYDNNGTMDLVVLEPVWENVGGDFIQYTVPRVFENTNGGFREVTKAAGLAGVKLESGRGLLSFADFNNDGSLDMLVVTLGSIRGSQSKWHVAAMRSFIDPYFSQKGGYLTCGSDNISKALNEFTPSIRESVSRRLSLSGTGVACMRYINSLPIFAYASLFTEDLWGSLDTPSFVEPGSGYLFSGKAGKFTFEPKLTSAMHVARDHMKEFILVRAVNAEGTFVSGRYYQPVVFDYNGDGHPDILFTSDFGSNLLLENMGNFNFRDSTRVASVHEPGSGMGASVADWNHDGLLDVAITNVLHTSLLEGNGEGVFVNRYASIGLSSDRMGWGVSFLDYNLDGWDDLIVTNGQFVNARGDAVSEPAIHPIFTTDALYRNESGNRMSNVSGEDICPIAVNGYTVAVSDFDNDGDPDVFSGTLGSGDFLYRNQISHDDTHFLKIYLQGTKSNRMGVGSLIRVTSGDMTQTKTLMIGSGNAAENGTAFLFGLGASSAPVDVHVKWPSGQVSNVYSVNTDQVIRLKEGAKGMVPVR